MEAHVARLAKYWKYSEPEIQASLAQIWRWAFLNWDPLPEEICKVLYPILVQNEASRQIHGLTVEILLLSENLPMTFSNNFSGQFYSYIQSGSSDCLRLLLSLETSDQSLVVKNAPLLVDDLIHLAASDELEGLKSAKYPVVPAIAHCLRYFPNFIMPANRRSIMAAIERLMLRDIAILVNHRIEQMEMRYDEQTLLDSFRPSGLSLGMVNHVVNSLINHTSIKSTSIAIFYKLVTIILENEDEEAVSLLKDCRSTVLIDIVQVLQTIAARCPEESARVLTFLSEICMRFDENVSLVTLGALLSVTGTLNSSAIEKLTHIVSSSYMDPLIAYNIVKFVDNYFEKLQKMKWIDRWFPVMFKLACARPLCFTKYLIRWVSMRSKRTSSILTSILNLPSICSTVEFSQLMEFDTNLKNVFRIAVQNDPDVLRAYTNLLRNSYESRQTDLVSGLPRQAVADRSQMWLLPSFRVKSICSTLLPLVNAFFESEFNLCSNLKKSVSIAIENCFSWLTVEIQAAVSDWVLKAFEHCPKLVIELHDSIRDCISSHLLSQQQEFVLSMIYCIGEYGMRCREYDSFIADYIDFLEDCIIQLLNYADRQFQSQQEFQILPPWSPCIPGKRCVLTQIDAKKEQLDASRYEALLCMSLTALAKLSVALPNKSIKAFEFVQDEDCLVGPLVYECLQEAKMLVRRGLPS